jgi:hypothetical protein
VRSLVKSVIRGLKVCTSLVAAAAAAAGNAQQQGQHEGRQQLSNMLGV